MSSSFDTFSTGVVCTSFPEQYSVDNISARARRRDEKRTLLESRLVSMASGNLQSCGLMDCTQTPPPVVVKVHYKKHILDNPLLLSAALEAEKTGLAEQPLQSKRLQKAGSRPSMPFSNLLKRTFTRQNSTTKKKKLTSKDTVTYRGTTFTSPKSLGSNVRDTTSNKSLARMIRRFTRSMRTTLSRGKKEGRERP
ncbi:uncharacterized protein [Palaemon carinicauda]|uniref:uncharacterized protein n=1 Tax=Palaemon carinicauda TaxID=392227 RepID=UPI0035B5BD96